MILLDDPNRPPGGRQLTLPAEPPLIVRTGDLLLSVLWSSGDHGPGAHRSALESEAQPFALRLRLRLVCADGHTARVAALLPVGT